MNHITGNSTKSTQSVNATHIADMDVRDEAIERLITQGNAACHSANTRKTYDIGHRSWARWAANQGVSISPADPAHLQMWLVALAEQYKKPSTWRTYLAGVAHHHREYDGLNPADDRQVRQLLRGLTRKSSADGYAAKQAAPLRWSQIQRIADTAHKPRYNQPGGRAESPPQARQRANADIAMVTVAHDAALRGSELLSLTWADIEPSQGSECGLVKIRRSKSDQTGQGFVVPISEIASQALARLKPDNTNPNHRIFNFSTNTLSRRLRAAAQNAGIDLEHISSHSPRVGMAQDLAAHGTSMPGLMQAGRWKTPVTAARYTQHLTAHHTAAARYLKTQRLTNPLDHRET